MLSCVPVRDRENQLRTAFESAECRVPSLKVRYIVHVCMAWRRLDLLVRLTLSLSFYLVVQCLSILAFDDPALPSQDRSGGSQKRAQVTSFEETKEEPARHGMHMKAASLTTTARGSSVALLGSAGASLAVESRRSLRSFTRSGRRWHVSGSSSECWNGSGGSSWGDSWNNRSVVAAGGGGRARRALSSLAPAVAPRAGTSALFVVSAFDPAVSLATTREATPAGTAAAGAVGSVFAAERARCRCGVRGEWSSALVVLETVDGG